ncbi:HTH-type transcriptional activator Btr [Paenibacillus konkukensis]|uniref:HTH-type transcriptional activator Btr n=1 Tax=Paenibacillus konkukensis TaxID=2020716 RepID=A0ABY4RK60_9BACL|nr:AraC family transcriptional regulator [Paenibacillus konkukensis]UQZ82854.1 HTH-type transcriptional activator Btr [Paenibacillus konkukensis]
MAYDLNELHLHIHWVLDKPTAPGWTDKRNNIGAHTLYWIHEGKGTFHTEQTYPVEGGMLAYMPPGLAMSMESDGRFPLRMTMILFDCAAVGYDKEWTCVAPVGRLELPFLRSFGLESSMRLSGQFRDIYRCWVPGAQGGALLALIHELHATSDNGAAVRDSAASKMDMVKDYLETSYYSEFTIGQLADRFGISVSYLRKMFLQHVGMSPKHYHNHIRNEHAKHYLMYSDLPVKEIAKACGYLEEYHFSKSFKKLNGLPPSKFRETHRLDFN